MKTLITDPLEIRRAANQLRGQLEKLGAFIREREIKFPGGMYSDCVEHLLNCSQGKLYAMFTEDWGERIPFLFSLNPRTKDFTSDVEINFPLGLDRRVNGCFVKEGDKISICHRGRFTKSTSSIPKIVALHYFKESLIPIDDAGKDAQVILISSLGSTNLTDEIVNFLINVKGLKGSV
jgi:hypothetical protein